MRKPLAVMIVLALLAGGCEDPAAKQVQQNRQRFLQILDLVATAEQGFVPGDVKDPRAADLESFRQKTLAEAAKQLRDILDKPPVSQRIAASQLLARLETSSARYKTGQAVVHWAGISERTSSMLSTFIAVARAHARAELYDADESATLTKLNADRLATQQRLTDLTAQADGLRTQLADLNARILKLQEQRAQLQDGAQKLRADALGITKDGKKQFETQKTAIEMELKANQAEGQADLLRVQTDRITSELAILDQRVALATKWSQSLNDQTAEAQQREKGTAAQRDKALAAKKILLEGDPTQVGTTAKNPGLDKQFASVAQDYDELVRGPLNDAAAQLVGVLDVLAKAQTLATSAADRDAIKHDVLSARVDLTYVYQQHIVAAGGYGDTLELIAARAPGLLPERAEGIQAAAKSIKDEQDKLIEVAKENVEKAKALSGDLSSSQLGPSAAQQLRILESYSQRMTAAAIQPAGPVASAAPVAPTPGPAPVAPTSLQPVPAIPTTTTPAPAPAPAVAPAPVPAVAAVPSTAQTPQALGQALVDSFSNAKKGQFVGLFDQSTDDGKKAAAMIGGMFDALVGMKKLEEAVGQKFGEDAAKQLHAKTAQTAQTMGASFDELKEKFDQVKFAQTGDTATMTVPSDDPAKPAEPVKMVKKNGVWLFDTSDFSQAPPQMIAVMGKLINATTDLAQQGQALVAQSATVDEFNQMMDKQAEKTLGPIMQEFILAALGGALPEPNK